MRTVTGRRKYFHRLHGYGFLYSEEVDGDIFVHCTAKISENAWTCLLNRDYDDTELVANIVKTDKGWQALQVDSAEELDRGRLSEAPANGSAARRPGMRESR
jgi:cold shock CspA family protein